MKIFGEVYSKVVIVVGGFGWVVGIVVLMIYIVVFVVSGVVLILFRKFLKDKLDWIKLKNEVMVYYSYLFLEIEIK